MATPQTKKLGDSYELGDNVVILLDAEFRINVADSYRLYDRINAVQLVDPTQPGDINNTQFGIEVTLFGEYTAGIGPGTRVSQFGVEVIQQKAVVGQRVTQFGIEVILRPINEWQIYETREI